MGLTFFAAGNLFAGDAASERHEYKLTYPSREIKPLADCAPDDHVCLTNRKIDEIENAITESSQDIDRLKIWDAIWKEDPVKERSDEDKKPGKTKYGLKGLKYAARTPNYAIRAVTWPVAIGADYMIEKGVMRKIADFFSSKDKTFWLYPTLELGFGNSTAFGVGLRELDMFDRNYRLAMNYQIHINLDQSASLKFSKPDAAEIGGHALSYYIGTNWGHYRAGNFYGVGPSSKRNNQAIYGSDLLEWGGGAALEIFHGIHADASLMFSSNWSRSGENGLPSVETIFPAWELPGFRNNIIYLAPAIGLWYDNRDSQYNSQKGGRYSFNIRRYQGINHSGFSYIEYDADAIYFIKLWVERHVLVLHANFLYNQSTNGKVPFTRLANIDVYSPVRGFSAGRFQDNGRYVMNAAYRFPVWSFLDGEIFFDAGRVFHEMSDLSFSNIKYAGGGGLRIRSKNYFLARFQVGYGGEGVKIMFKTSQEF